MNWRAIYITSIVARFYFATTNSYIHPDEHFQSLQVVSAKFLNYNCPSPWEFNLDLPARSFGPLYVFYGPILILLKFFGHPSPLVLWYIFRLNLTVINWLITDYVLYKLLPIKPERLKAIFFASTSYITLVYQLHLFSNSFETSILLLSILIINNLRDSIENQKQNQDKINNSYLFALGLLIGLGIFNRITFLVFILIPSFFIFKYVLKNWQSLFYIGFGFLSISVCFILIDTYTFIGDFNHGWVLTPLNSLIYNSSIDNLSNHGLHSWYTHLLINLPMMFGPGLLFLFGYDFKNKYYKTLPFLTFLSGTLILSIIPHQELRFLMPLVPMAVSCFDLTRFETDINTTDKKVEEKDGNNLRNDGNTRKLSARIVNILINLWLAFNILMSVLMGVFHQGGVIPALDFIHQNSLGGIHIWWRTYSPPTWMLADDLNSFEYLTINNESELYEISNIKQNLVIDTMGLNKNEFSKLLQLVSALKKPIYIITPSASFNLELKNSEFEFESIYHYKYHLDMDHLDFSNFESLRPGLDIYRLL